MQVYVAFLRDVMLQSRLSCPRIGDLVHFFGVTMASSSSSFVSFIVWIRHACIKES